MLNRYIDPVSKEIKKIIGELVRIHYDRHPNKHLKPTINIYI